MHQHLQSIIKIGGEDTQRETTSTTQIPDTIKEAINEETERSLLVKSKIKIQNTSQTLKARKLNYSGMSHKQEINDAAYTKHMNNKFMLDKKCKSDELTSNENPHMQVCDSH
jgi:hypothetical protein